MLNKTALKILKPIVVIIIIYVSFKLSLIIAHSFGLPIIMAGSPVGLLFYPIYLIVVLLLMGVLSFGSWYLLNYVLEKVNIFEPSVTPDKSNSQDRKLSTQDKDKMPFASVIFKTSKAVGITIVIVILALVVYAYFISSLGNKSAELMHKRNVETFHTQSNVEDHKDSKIIFYVHELQKSSADFIMADNSYSLFKADVKRSIAIDCITILIQEYDLSIKYSTHPKIQAFKKNARNKYANTDQKIEKAIKNAKIIEKNSEKFYYPLASGYLINSSVGNSILDRCKNQLTAQQIYESYISNYIEAKEKDLENWIAQPKRRNQKRAINTKTEWLELLYREHPKYSQN